MAVRSEVTRSALVVLEKIAKDGPLYPKEISDQVGLAPRTVTLALRNLLKMDLCKKVPNFSDMRKPLYHADIQAVKKLQREFEIWRSMSNLHVRA
ncbi:MAG: MarR family transcriptional regulator [Candidatus Thorarchaeota archaeon]|nr:MarR family transcriptional regulator [Candidatus Thorarchaeota archaeon]